VYFDAWRSPDIMDREIDSRSPMTGRGRQAKER
jgi:hypothetical protein